jgi:hypothetical protein
MNTNTRNNRIIVGCVIFYAVGVLWNESVGLSVYPLSLLGNGSVKTFRRQWRIVGGEVFYAVRIVSKENRRLVLPRNSCILFHEEPNPFSFSLSERCGTSSDNLDAKCFLHVFLCKSFRSSSLPFSEILASSRVLWPVSELSPVPLSWAYFYSDVMGKQNLEDKVMFTAFPQFHFNSSHSNSTCLADTSTKHNSVACRAISRQRLRKRPDLERTWTRRQRNRSC